MLEKQKVRVKPTSVGLMKFDSQKVPVKYLNQKIKANGTIPKIGFFMIR